MTKSVGVTLLLKNSRTEDTYILKKGKKRGIPTKFALNIEVQQMIITEYYSEF